MVEYPKLKTQKIGEKLMKQCTNCGSQNELNAAVCGNCGSPFQAAPVDQQYAPPPQPPPQQYPPQQPYQQQYQQPPIGHPHSKYSTLGGWLLLVVIGNIIGVIADAAVSIPGIQETISLLEDVEFYNMYIPNFGSALYVTLIGEIVGLLTIVFTILFIVQVFQRKSTFLRFHPATKRFSALCRKTGQIACA